MYNCIQVYSGVEYSQKIRVGGDKYVRNFFKNELVRAKVL